MQLRLRPFPAEAVGVVSGWAATDEEVLMSAVRRLSAVRRPHQ
jgi:hypothetical protein